MFSSFPPKISVPIFYLYITIAVVIRFFVGSIYGIFIVAIFVYKYSESLFGINPLNLNELMLWFVSQSEAAVTAIMSAFITVIGFFLAYATAKASWKEQLLANLKLQAAGDIDIFFSEYSKLATDCQIYASSLVEAVNKIQKGCVIDEAIFLANFNIDQAQIFLQKRQRLITMGIDVHGFQSRYSLLLTSAPFLNASLDSAIAAVHRINEKLWFVVPYHVNSNNNVVQTFVNQINVADCLALNAAVEQNHGELNFSSGGVRGNLMSTVIGFNIWSMLYLYKKHKSFYGAIKERYSKIQNLG